MCQWYCTSEGPFTNLHCLHCGCRYCGACLHGEGGKMESLIKCASCGKKPRVKSNMQRRAWAGEPASPAGTSKTVISPTKRGQATRAYWEYKQGYNWDSPSGPRTIFDKLCDPSLYTGSHRHRFDAQGRGRGLEGRESVSKGMGTNAAINYYGDGPVFDLAQLTRNQHLDPAFTVKVRALTDGSTVLTPHNRSMKNADSTFRPETPRHVYPHNNPQFTPGRSARSSVSSHGGRVDGSPLALEQSPIFDKLTDPALYTGTQRTKFEQQGTPCDSLPPRPDVNMYASPVVHDLSQITRPNFNPQLQQQQQQQQQIYQQQTQQTHDSAQKQKYLY